MLAVRARLTTTTFWPLDEKISIINFYVLPIENGLPSNCDAYLYCAWRMDGDTVRCDDYRCWAPWELTVCPSSTVYTNGKRPRVRHFVITARRATNSGGAAVSAYIEIAVKYTIVYEHRTPFTLSPSEHSTVWEKMVVVVAVIVVVVQGPRSETMGYRVHGHNVDPSRTRR